MFSRITFATLLLLSQNALTWAEAPKEGFREALGRCAKLAGLNPPTPGQGVPPQPPTEEQRKKIDQCLKDAGFNPPPGPPPGGPRPGAGGPPPPPRYESSSEESSSGAGAGSAY